MLDFLTKKISKIFGTKADKDLKQLLPYVDLVNDEFEKLSSLSDGELRGRTKEIMDFIDGQLSEVDSQIQSLHDQIAEGEETLNVDEKEALFQQIDSLEKERNTQLEDVLLEVLPQAFAVVKDTARRLKENKKLVVPKTSLDEELATRCSHVEIEGDNAIWHNKWSAAGTEVTWDMIHYDVQIVGGVVLHQGKIAEMATGEGKTLVATFPAYLNALARRGVHIVTVNDYLAKRDSEWVGPLMEFHGLRVDCIDNYEPHSPGRINAYEAAITYGTNNEFGFDYLRDNMAGSLEQQVQPRHHFTMIDEVDSVLIDDARTPLIISGPVERGDQDQQFQALKPRIESLFAAQRKLTQGFLNEAKKLIKEGNTDEGALALFRAYRGLPKNKPLIKYLSEPGIRQIMQKKEAYYLQENSKQMPEADEPLFFTIDEKSNSIELTEKGLDRLTKDNEEADFFVLPDISIALDEVENDESLSDQEKPEKKDEIIHDYNIKAQRIHTVNQLLKAYTLFEKDVDYVIMDNKVMIVDEQTGRVMEGRRYSDGLHQALEAREGVKIEEATQTYATVTLQNYFRMYHKLSGMTGTAETVAGEFWEIYKLDVVVIPTNEPVVRDDRQDLIYKTMREKYNASVGEIQRLIDQGRPVLVGTTSVENSEILSRLLKMRQIDHQVLNAKQHAKEADVVARAGKPGNVTIATNMAGRGTDIKLPPESKQAGGLAIIGTERHESRRVDRQLRGRAGRQGDAGSSQFFVSLEDNLMRLFGSEKMAKIMDGLGLEDGEVIQHNMITKSIERAQRKVEENNFSIRKRLLEYDDVMNAQREVIYKQRKNALDGERLGVDILNSFYDLANEISTNTQGDFNGFQLRVWQAFSMEAPITEEKFGQAKPDALTQLLFEKALEHYEKHKQYLIEELVFPIVEKSYQIQEQNAENILVHLPLTDGYRTMVLPANLKKVYEDRCASLMTEMEKSIVLSIIDHNWKEHLREMDDLKTQVQNASYEQKDPLLVYKFEAFELFRTFVGVLNEEIVSFLSKVDVPIPDEEELDRMQAEQRAQEEKRHKQAQVARQQQQVQAQKAKVQSALGSSHAESAVPDVATKEPPQKVAPRRSNKVYGRNAVVSVRYQDGTVKEGVKYKKVAKDIDADRCVVIER